MAGNIEHSFLSQGKVTRPATHLEGALLLQPLLLLPENHDLVVSSHGDIDPTVEVSDLSQVVKWIHRDLVGHCEEQSIVLVAENPDCVVQLAGEVKQIAPCLPPANCPGTCSFQFDGLFLAKDSLFQGEGVPVDDVRPQIRDEENVVVLREDGAVWVRTGLSVGIEAASLMSDEGVHSGWQVVRESIDDNRGTGVIGCHDKLASGIDGGLAGVVPHRVNPGDYFEILVQRDQKSCLVLSKHIVVAMMADHV